MALVLVLPAIARSINGSLKEPQRTPIVCLV